MAAAVLALLSAFGARTALIGWVFWCTQAPASFMWTGGAFLRQDWLFLLVLGACLFRRGRPFGAGAALTYAALLRVFPIFFLLGPGLIVLAHAVRRRGLAPAHRRFLRGCALALAIMLPAGAVAAGPSAYADFAGHIHMHADTQISNHMSLRTPLSWTPSSRLKTELPHASMAQVKRWKEARSDTFYQHRWWFVFIATISTLWYLWVVIKLRTLWLALSLGVVPLMTWADPSCYYYSFWLLAVLLAHVRPSLQIALMALAGIGQVVVLRVLLFEERYLLLACLYLAMGWVFLAMFSRPFPWTRSGAMISSDCASNACRARGSAVARGAPLSLEETDKQ